MFVFSLSLSQIELLIILRGLVNRMTLLESSEISFRTSASDLDIDITRGEWMKNNSRISFWNFAFFRHSRYLHCAGHMAMVRTTQVNPEQNSSNISFLEILFAACGSFVYTIWIKHRPLPSMLTLCQMKIKENLLNNSLQNLDKLFLPNNLRQNLQSFYRSTIKGFLPDPKSLRSFVCNPLKSHLRLQCTMKRIDHQPEYISTIPTNTNLPGATYVLYLEYLGGLIPLLTAKRVSKICPDFIIFDPQMKTNHLSTVSPRKMHSRKRHFSSFHARSNTIDQTSPAQPQSTKSSSNISNRSSLITNRNSIYVADNGLNNNGDDMRTNKSSSGCSSDNDSDMDDDEQQQQNDGRRRNHLIEKPSRKKGHNSSKVVKHKHVRDID